MSSLLRRPHQMTSKWWPPSKTAARKRSVLLHNIPTLGGFPPSGFFLLDMSGAVRPRAWQPGPRPVCINSATYSVINQYCLSRSLSFSSTLWYKLYNTSEWQSSGFYWIRSVPSHVNMWFNTSQENYPMGGGGKIRFALGSALTFCCVFMALLHNYSAQFLVSN